MALPLPGLFSMMNGCRNTAWKWLVTSRAAASEEPPAAAGTTMRTRRAGQSCAAVGGEGSRTAAVRATIAKRGAAFHIIIPPPHSPLVRRQFLAPPTEALHHRLVGDAQQHGLARCLVPMRTPGGGRDDVAAPPCEPLAVDRGCSFALHHSEDIVCRGAIGGRANGGSKPHHVERRGHERRVAEFDLRGERLAGFGLCLTQPAQRVRTPAREGP